MLYERALAESERLDSEIQKITTQLSTYPPGKLVISRHNNYTKWFLSNGKTNTYIPKKQRSFAELLAAKRYLLCKLDDLQKEKVAILKYLQHHKSSSSKADALLHPSSSYSELLSPFFKTASQEVQLWLQEPFSSNPKHPEQLIYKCPSGHTVRSKSEVIIATLLYQHKIPFRYEAALILNGITIYPDFTIFHPIRKEIIYWEHFGMMDNPSYRQHTSAKLQNYISNGFTPSINLICTFESNEKPLSIEEIEQTIRLCFL